MSKLVKELVTKDLASRYLEQDNAVWVEIVGVDGNTTNAFRRDLRAKAMRLEVVKTALLRRACANGPMAGLAEKLSGPAALVTGGESAIDVAKLLDEWAPKFPKNSIFRLRGALLDGELFSEEAVQTLHKMPSKRDLQARIVGAALSPGGNLVAAMLSGGSNIAGCLKTMIEKLEDGEEITKKTA
jgi:large subunit ribosomal protein L10